MPSERVQRQIDRLLDEVEAALAAGDWEAVKGRSDAVLRLDPENQDARTYLKAATTEASGDMIQSQPAHASDSAQAQPSSFANGRYTVKRFLGEGGKKKVYLAHDASLDRDVAFALIKTEGLDAAARERITREAQAMGRLGAHPHIVTVFDIGEENGQPYLVLPVLGGGDVEGIIEKAPEHKLPIEQAVKIAVETCMGLEFAHGKGIIHRDIKPGNVWLTEDGRAMVGDFGLAVAVDRSRLTQAGMMVGTVNYMPPEQAMGGEITSRSDLYALGAMLYEMVCGRPPFVGDESVAIIGQHLNTPPVAPSWHRPDCPPALEALILRLLEKDPGKRPESATEVREALQSIGHTGSRAGDSEPVPLEPVEGRPGTDPLYRRTFVGRENEVRQLQQAFDGAMSGNGGLVMVVGEPGIGKTALCEQLATYVALRGGKALVGHCYEEGSLSLPYLAFVEAMRSYVLARDPDGLRSDLGTGAGEVARIVSEVRDRVQGVELRPAGDPEDDRWRLLQSVTTFLRNASTVQPLAIVLEDLHWADRGTLDLLLHISRNLQGARLLIVGTYRDVEVDRSHPLSATLAELRRQERFLRVPLRGLSVDEVHRMYEAIRGQEVPWGQAELVHRQTEGNPLFVQEVLRYLVEEGIVVREAGRYIAQGPGIGIPDGLRDVIGRRLSHLDERTNAVLAIASVVGREFRLDVLQEVASLPEDELFGALEEASERAILEQVQTSLGVVFRFTHAMFRTLLYEEIFAPRRIRLHQQVGRALERVHSRRLEEHAAELAEHFSQSTEASDLEEAVHYGELAAQRSVSVYAYGEAVRHLEQALRAEEVLNPEDKSRRCDLLLALGGAQLPLGNPPGVFNGIAHEAFLLAESLHDDLRAAQACRLAFEALERGAPLRGDWDIWLLRADRVAPPDSADRVYADVAFRGMFTNSLLRTPVERRDELDSVKKGFELAERLGQLDLIYWAGWHLIGPSRLTPNEIGACVETASRIEALPRAGASPRNIARFLIFAASAHLMTKNRRGWQRLGNELGGIAERTHDVNISLSHQSHAGIELMLDGRLDEAIELSSHWLEVGGQAGALLNMVGAVWVQASFYQQDAKDVLGRAGPVTRPWSQTSPWVAWQALLAHSAALDEDALSDLRADTGPALDLLVQFGPEGVGDAPAVGLGNLLVAAINAKRSDAISTVLACETAGDLAFTGTGIHVSFARLLGKGASVIGNSTRARSFFEKAIRDCEALHHRPDLALSHLDLAELLLDHYPDERDAAIEHLDFAIAEFRDMKMQPALERALGHRGLLKA